MLSKEAAQSSGLRVEPLLALISAPADNNKSTTGYQIPQIGIPGRTPDCLSTRTPPAECRDEGYGGQRKCFGSSESKIACKGVRPRIDGVDIRPPLQQLENAIASIHSCGVVERRFAPIVCRFDIQPCLQQESEFCRIWLAAAQCMLICSSVFPRQCRVVGIAPRSKRNCTVESFPHIVAQESIVSPFTVFAQISAPASTRILTHVSSDFPPIAGARACVRNRLRETC
jgi:hypothetical protein